MKYVVIFLYSTAVSFLKCILGRLLTALIFLSIALEKLLNKLENIGEGCL